MNCSEDSAGSLHIPKKKKFKIIRHGEIVNLLTITYFSYFDSFFTCHAPEHNIKCIIIKFFNERL